MNTSAKNGHDNCAYSLLEPQPSQAAERAQPAQKLTRPRYSGSLPAGAQKLRSQPSLEAHCCRRGSWRRQRKVTLAHPPALQPPALPPMPQLAHRQCWSLW